MMPQPAQPAVTVRNVFRMGSSVGGYEPGIMNSLNDGVVRPSTTCAPDVLYISDSDSDW